LVAVFISAGLPVKTLDGRFCHWIGPAILRDVILVFVYCVFYFAQLVLHFI